jgi:beta-lactamase regulating signal transducer with metallopeptidase domain
MIAAWMLYSVAVTAVLGVCALALEHGLRRRGMPLRWLWAGALLASLVVSALPWMPSREEAYIGVYPEWAGSPQVVNASRGVLVYRPAPDVIVAADPWLVARLEVLDRPLLAFWALATAMGALYLIGTHRTLARRRRLWRRTLLDGVPTLVSRDVGPAVVGFLDSAIVVPGWVMEMDPEQRRLVLAHEEEHLRAGDVRLLSLALLAVALAPWNAAVWWQLRRLRHAVELDCDARVLDGEADAERYCDLLIEVGARAPMRGVAFAAFAESRSMLESRIMSMVGPRPRRWAAAAGVCVALAGLALVYACEAPVPTLPVVEEEIPEFVTVVDEPGVPVVVDSAVAVAVDDAEPVAVEAVIAAEPAAPGQSPDEVSPTDMAELVRRRHPDVYARGLPLEQAVWFAIGAHGGIRKSWVGPNLYINFASYRPMREEALPVGSPERARAVAEHQRRERETVQANVPGMRVQGMYASYFYSEPANLLVHFVTDQPSPIPPGWRVGLATHAVAAALRKELAR